MHRLVLALALVACTPSDAGHAAAQRAAVPAERPCTPVWTIPIATVAHSKILKFGVQDTATTDRELSYALIALSGDGAPEVVAEREGIALGAGYRTASAQAGTYQVLPAAHFIRVWRHEGSTGRLFSAWYQDEQGNSHFYPAVLGHGQGRRAGAAVAWACD